jgi:hypothetical protein
MIVIKTNNIKNITKAVAKNTATKHGQVLIGAKVTDN